MESITRGVLVFDMDGVLVDVRDSYRATIVEVVRHFTGRTIEPELIQEYKNRGGWNNDWLLSQKMIFDLEGKEVRYQALVDVFQNYFLGTPSQGGLRLQERWIPRPDLLTELSAKYDLAIFTGRLRAEAEHTLDRFAPGIVWTEIAADDTVPRPKPSPDGLLQIQRIHPGRELLYFGDTIDDAASARDAGVRFVGISHSGNPRQEELSTLLRQHGAVAVLENINEIAEVL
ncbi:MAG: HAD hydrolase-like protein [Bryobacteraceae bacterium]|nr:HAD hydrolase-like protein [Bryobacteraceae bacterium]